MPTPLKKSKYKVKKLQGGGTPEGEPGKVSTLLDMLAEGAPSDDVYGYVASVDPTFGQSEIQAAKDYHLKRLDSPIYRQQVERAVLDDPNFVIDLTQGRIPGSKHLKTSYSRRAGEEKPELSKEDALLVDILKHESWLSGKEPSRKRLRHIFKDLPLKDKPLTKKGKEELYGQLLEEGQEDLIDRLIDYRRSLIEENPVSVKTLDEEGDWNPDLPWRPEGMEDIYGIDREMGSGTRGTSLNPAYGDPREEYDLMKDREFTTGILLGERDKGEKKGRMRDVRFMGPQALQEMQDRHRISNILADDPVSMKDAAIEEIGHSSDPGSRYKEREPLEQTRDMINRLSLADAEGHMNWNSVEGGEQLKKERVTDRGYDDKYIKYLLEPTEANQRLERVRSHLLDAGIDVLNKPIDLKDPEVQAALKDLEGREMNPWWDLQAIFTDEDIETLLNKAP